MEKLQATEYMYLYIAETSLKNTLTIRIKFGQVTF